MKNALQISNAIEAALVQGDLSLLSADQRISYYKAVCDSVGLNPLTKPFDYIMLNNKLTLYAKRDATDQLRKIYKISITISARETIGDVYVVTARAKDKSGREDESTGAVSIANLKGEPLANAFMKAETKAKRRVTLSACGLGLLDETELEPDNHKLLDPGAVPHGALPPPNAAAPEEPKPRTRKELGVAIRNASDELNLTKDEVAKWIFGDFKKTGPKLTLEEMEQFLGTLETEIGSRKEIV